MQIKFETRKRNAGFYILRQGVPERHSSEGYASFFVLFFSQTSQALVLARRAIPGASIVGLVTNKEFCKVVWEITIKNLLYKSSFIVNELLR